MRSLACTAHPGRRRGSSMYDWMDNPGHDRNHMTSDQAFSRPRQDSNLRRTV